MDIVKLRQLFIKYGYVMRTAELHANKVYYSDRQKLLEAGIIEQIKRGYYYLIDPENVSEVNIIHHLFPEAILCMDTALFYYGYTDRTPAAWHLAVDKDIRKSRFKIDYPFVKPYYWEAHLLPFGLTEGAIDGNTVRIYDKERIVCDCLKYSGKMEKELFNKAIQSYVNDTKKNIPNLMQYAKELRVEKKVRDLIGVWL